MSNGLPMATHSSSYVAGDAARLQHMQQRGAGAADIGLHLGQGDPQSQRDLLVGKLIEVIEHERHSLMLRQTPQRIVDHDALLFRAQVREQRVRQRQFRLGADVSSSVRRRFISENSRQRLRYRVR